MVFLGKPSTACALCRKRKIKCDKLHPACSQCRRVGAQCSGYRDPLDLLFRDQRAQAARKVLQQATNVVHNHATVQTFPVHGSRNLECTGSWVIHRLSAPPDDLAKQLFIHHFVSGDILSCSIFGSILNTAGTEETALTTAASTVGYALLCNLGHSPDNIALVRQKYGAAIRKTFDTLQHPVVSDSKSVLLAVVLLAIFETIMCNEPQSMNTWASHMAGAIAFLDAKGLEVKTRDDLCVYLQFRHQTLINSLQRNNPAPKSVFRWSDQARQFMTPDEIIYDKLHMIMFRFADVQASFRTKEQFGSTTTLSNLLSLDSELDNWVRSLPASWKFTKLTPTDEIRHDTQATLYYRYPNHTVAAAWTCYRTGRSLINDMIYALARLMQLITPYTELPVDLEYHEHQARAVVRTLCDEIYASMPFLLGYMDNPKIPLTAGMAYQTMWALSVSVCVACTDQSRRIWAIQQLEQIEDQTGIHQALSLAHVLKAKVGLRTQPSMYDQAWDNVVLRRGGYGKIRADLERMDEKNLNW